VLPEGFRSEGAGGGASFVAPALVLSTARQPVRVWLDGGVGGHDDDGGGGGGSGGYPELRLSWAVVSFESMARAAAAQAEAPGSGTAWAGGEELAGGGFKANDCVPLARVTRVDRVSRSAAAARATAAASDALGGAVGNSSLRGAAGAGRASGAAEAATQGPFALAVYASARAPTPGQAHATAAAEASRRSQSGEVLVLRVECGSEAERDAMADALEMLFLG
jgi:hypothetical protein